LGSELMPQQKSSEIEGGEGKSGDDKVEYTDDDLREIIRP